MYEILGKMTPGLGERGRGGGGGERSLVFLEESPESQGAGLCTSPCIPVPGQSE